MQDKILLLIISGGKSSRLGVDKRFVEVGGIAMLENKMLSAFYRRELAELFSKELSNGQRKIFSTIKKIPHEVVKLSSEEFFFNVKRGRVKNLNRTTPIISIIAPCSGTGKTIFIERLIKTI